MKIQRIYSLLFSCCLLALTACGDSDAYENEVDGGVEYGENTQAIGYEEPRPGTPGTPDFVTTSTDSVANFRDSIYVDTDGTYPRSIDAERNDDGIDEVEEMEERIEGGGGN